MNAYPPSIPRFRLLPGLVVLAALGTLAAGCGGQKQVHADTRESPLTQGEGVRVRPLHSPDGSWIAYTDAGAPDHPAVFVIPAEGGAPRRVGPEGLAAAALAWAADSRALYLSLPYEGRIQVFDLENRLLEEIPVEPMAWLEDLSHDGKRRLWCKLNGDNYDLGLVLAGADTVWRALEETPTWETDACFGPGPEDVTVVRQASFNATVNEVGILSLRTRLWTALPIPKARNSEPTWSPDGTLLAFVSDRSGSSDLWVFDSENTRLVQVAGGPEEEVHPDWSPDGGAIVFTRLATSSHVFIGDAESFTSRQRTHGEARDFHPRVSPDGQRVAFYRKQAPPEPGPARVSLCVADADGGEPTALDLAGLNPTVGEWMFAWSPDGAEIAFAADDGTGNVDLYRMDLDGGRPGRVTIEPGMDVLPAWSPDGRMLAYTRLAGGETQVWVVPATGGLAVQLSNHDGVNQVPVWAPDSRRIAYMSTRSDGSNEVRLVGVDLPQEARILYAGREHKLPCAWSADGARVLLFRESSEDWGVEALSLDGSPPRRVATGLTGDSRFFARFEPGYESLRERVYPGDVLAFTDGKKMANLVRVDVARLLDEEFQATGD